jgi:membrane-bound lytic murein transglycosylase B
MAGLIWVSAVGGASAFAVDTSLRPTARSAPQSQTATVTRALTGQAMSLRPVQRPNVIPQAEPVLAASNAGFQSWVNSFKSRARRAGITDNTLNRAFQNARYDPEVIKRDRNQSEFTKTLWDYLDSAASDTRVRNGKSALRKNARLLDRIEAHYGVDKEVVTAIWGLESAYGTFRGSKPVIGSLATLAYDGRRGRFFEGQLVSALKILQSGDVSPRNFTGSWAGAMGHTQFIPSSYLSLAVDFDGDGKRDIWSDDPTDALASTAAYLKRYGWRKGMPWGVEVTLPRGFDYAQANRSIKKMPSDWAKLGVTGMNGKAVPNYGSASVLVPAGAQGAAFLIFKNFDVIERYNTADAYVIGVGHLSDRLKGAGPIKSSWPRGDRALSFSERKEMQRLLRARGLYDYNIDGKIGPLTIDAVRSFQRSQNMVPDGYPSLRILQKLR